MNDVVLIDSGGANIASLSIALDRLGVNSRMTEVAEEIRAASHVILPGVGAANHAMQRLRESQLTELLAELTQPVLGICLGMQLLGNFSEEDETDCLGIVDAEAEALPASPGSPVPNMGWCAINKGDDHALLDGINDGEYFYFLHSYALPVGPYTIAEARHRSSFTAVLARDNFLATQFHPERSSGPGARVLQNFLRM